MLKKILLSLVIFIAAINTVIAFYDYIWPLIDSHGVIKAGEYRGLLIGDRKRDIILKTTFYRTNLKISAYSGLNGETVSVFSENQSLHLLDSDKWALSYPSIHRETVHLSFQDDRLYEIRYVRDMFAP